MATANFTKSFLLGLKKTPPDKRTEHKDATKPYLRARATPKGNVSLEVVKTVPGTGKAQRIKFGEVCDDKLLARSTHPDIDDMPALPQVKAAADVIAGLIERREHKTARDVRHKQQRADELTIGRAIDEHIKDNANEWSARTTDNNLARKVGLEPWEDIPLTAVDATLLRAIRRGLIEQRNRTGKLIGETGATDRIKLLRAAYNTALITYEKNPDIELPPWPTSAVKKFVTIQQNNRENA